MLSLRINEFLIGFMAVSMDIAAAMILLFADTPGVAESDVQIWGSSRLIGLSVIGSSIGAMLSIAARKEATVVTESTRSLALGFLCSMGCGVAFAPMLLEWSNIGKREDAIIPFSAFCAFVAVKVAQIVMPYIEYAATRKAKKELGIDETDESAIASKTDKG